MKIERGIIGFNNWNEMIVRSPGHVYHLNNTTYYYKGLNENDKVVGVIVNNKFSVCREFISTNGRFIFGFVIKELSPKTIKVQTIREFDPNKFDPFNADYNFGEESIVEIN